MNKKLWWTRIIICMVTLLMVIPASGTAQAQEGDGYWELISVDVEEAPPPAASYTYNISRGSGTFRAVSSGGDSFQVSMTWTEPGQRYAGGQNIDLTLSVKIDEYNWYDDSPGYLHQGLNYMTAGIKARIDKPGINWSGVTGSSISLTDLQGKYYAKVETDYGKIGVGSQTLQVSAMFPPGGSDGDKKSIYVNCTAGMARYNYQWVEKASQENEVPAETTDTPEPTVKPKPAVELSCPEIHCDRNPNPRAIVRFGDLYGEVNVRENWEDDDAYLFAELGMGLCHCDRIRTLPRSGAILSWSDMSSFMMKEDTTIVLDIANKRETKLGFIAGKIWVNFKSMVKDGSMEVEMSQAVAGIKGTTVIFEENGSTSTIKVIEGTVEVRPNAGAPLTLSDGEMVSATNGIASAVVPFSIEDEIQTWDENVQQMTTQALAERKSSPSNSISSTWIFIGAIPGLLCFGLSFVILLAGFLGKNKKISLLGLVLIAIVICITLVAFAIYGGSQLLRY